MTTKTFPLTREQTEALTQRFPTPFHLYDEAAQKTDDGLFANTGKPLPEESRVLDMCSIENVDEEGYGEELVFDVASRFLGGRIDALENHTLALSQYEKRSAFSSLVKRLFARA